MDEVHIRSDASYKGGKIQGSIDNPNDPPTTVFSMMVSSLMKRFSTIVRLIPLGSSSAAYLHPIVRQTIFDIECCGLFLEAICTDNYPLNVNLYKLFSDVGKVLHPKVVHPCNPPHNLILFFDIVHIIKSIRNNWLNLKTFEKTFMYPKFEDCTFKQSQPVNPPCTQLKISLPIANISLNSAKLTKSNYPSINYAAFDDSVFCIKPTNSQLLKEPQN